MKKTFIKTTIFGVLFWYAGGVSFILQIITSIGLSLSPHAVTTATVGIALGAGYLVTRALQRLGQWFGQWLAKRLTNRLMTTLPSMMGSSALFTEGVSLGGSMGRLTFGEDEIVVNPATAPLAANDVDPR